MNTKEKLNALLEKKGRGAKAKLAKFLNVPPVYVTRWADNNYVEKMPTEYYVKVADFFSIHPSYFLDMKNSVGFAKVKFVPVVGSASCGMPADSAYQDFGDVAYCDDKIWNERLYAVIADGDSMADQIENGDKVICDPSAEIYSGDIVHYQIGSESGIKIYYERLDIGIIEFVPYNRSGDFKRISIRLDDEMISSVRKMKVIEINKSVSNNRKARLKLLGLN